jgi:hypothetical protein
MNKAESWLFWSKGLLVSFLVLLGLGCGLFNSGAISQRQDQNEAISGGTQLGQVTMAEGIGSGNAPVGPTDNFSSSQDVIYAVVPADHIEQGSTMFARWSRDGQPFEDSAEIVADRDYDNTYVEFHLENLRDRMDEGNYTVQIFVNGNPVQEASFTVE